MNDGILAKLLVAAGSAPSGDNTQPVRFEVSADGGTITMRLDPTRDPSPMNAGQRMARMAAGASMENLARMAAGLGLAVEVEGPSGEALAVVRLVGEAHAVPGDVPDLAARATNRRAYDGRPVAAEVLRRLERATPEVDGVTTHWIIGDDRLGPLADLIGRADAVMFGEPTMRQAFLSKIRFDEPPGKAVAEGLPVDALEVGAADRLALRAMRRAPNWLLKAGGAGRVFRAKARALVASSSGLCLVVAPDSADATDLAAGRALQRAWLALANEGLACQPMMSPMVLENIDEQGDFRLRTALGLDRLCAIRDEFRALMPEIAGRRPAWLQRFGHAPPPTARAGRLPVEAITTRRQDDGGPPKGFPPPASEGAA